MGSPVFLLPPNGPCLRYRDLSEREDSVVCVKWASGFALYELLATNHKPGGKFCWNRVVEPGFAWHDMPSPRIRSAREPRLNNLTAFFMEEGNLIP
ncbi:MAG: hypothetical protein JSS02_20415 [Planctomycetes bacterium]|nr:hypothetical protein [Planctomycetota bacterium]